MNLLTSNFTLNFCLLLKRTIFEGAYMQELNFIIFKFYIKIAIRNKYIVDYYNIF